jgi:two-component system, cell cycle response regulator DivK
MLDHKQTATVSHKKRSLEKSRVEVFGIGEIGIHRCLIGRDAERGNMAKTILIVEDNELNMKLFHDLLEAHNYQTLQTRDGNDALALAREHRPDLILMDIQLPGVSGLEVTRQIKADDELKSIPVVAVTAFAMKGDEDRIREGGCEAYIAKPIRIDELISTVQQFIGSE